MNLTPSRVELIIHSLTIGWIIGCINLVGCISHGQDTARLSPPQPPIPALPVITLETNNGKVFSVIRVERKPSTNHQVAKMDMPPAIPVSAGAPHHYYGIVEFKRTGQGRETENEVFYFGLFPNHEAFLRAHGVGNTRFTKRFTTVFRYPSELPLEATCVWQRSDGAGP